MAARQYRENADTTLRLAYDRHVCGPLVFQRGVYSPKNKKQLLRGRSCLIVLMDLLWLQFERNSQFKLAIEYNH